MDHKKYIEWDVYTWSRALDFWQSHAQSHGAVRGLELGGRHGGLSLFFAERLGSDMVCSDYGGPSDEAKRVLEPYTNQSKVEFADINALDINFPDNQFDFVVFKSVLPSLADGKLSNQQRAIDEVFRVLKPGGVMYFAENMRASALHKFGRKHFVKWGDRCRYISVAELDELLSAFSKTEIRFTGFFAVFAPARLPWLKRAFAKIDSLIDKLLPTRWKYVAFGAATK